MATNSILAKMAVLISANTADFNNKLAASSKSVASFQTSVGGLTNVLGGLGVAFGAGAVVAGVQSAVKTMASFEKQVDTVAAITGATGKDFQRLRQNALDLGRATEYTASEVAGLQIEYGRLGFTSEEILNATQATLNLATATGEDLSKAADVAGSTLRGFQLDASETNRVVDVMASSFNKSALSLENFRESMKYVAPVAKVSGATVEETTALLGVLADAGIRGSQAGTALRRIFSELAKDGRPLIERLQELSEKGLTLADAQDEVGAYAKTALLVLTSQTDKVQNLTYALNGAATEGERVANIMRDNLIGDVDKLTSAFEGLILSGSGVTGMLREMTQDLTNFISGITAGEDSMSFFAGWLKMVMTVPRYTLKGLSALADGYNALSKSIRSYLDEQKRLRDEALRLEQTVLFSDLKSGILGADGTKKAQARLLEIGKLLGEVRTNLEEALPDFNGENGGGGEEPPLALLARLEEQLKELKNKQNAAFDASVVMDYGRQIEALSAKISKLRSGRLDEEDPVDTLRRKKTLEQIYKPRELDFSQLTGGITESLNSRLSDHITMVENVTMTYEQWGEHVKTLSSIYDEEFNRIAQTATALSDILGSGFEEAIAGQQSFANILIRVTQQIVDLYAKQAIAAAIANAAKTGGPFPLASVVAAVAAAAAIKGLLSRALNTNFGGGGGGAGSVATPRESASSSFANAGPQTLYFKISGNDLVAAYDIGIRNNSQRRN